MSLINEQIAGFRTSALGEFSARAPWELTGEAIGIVEQLLNRCDQDYLVSHNVAVHKTSIVESGAVIKAPAIIGPGCTIAAGAYLRGGCWLEAKCIVGPGAELKSSFLFRDTKLAHFNFVGDSILGCEVNLEAGAIIANYRNERDHPAISLVHNGHLIETGVTKFGALVGDRTRIGANAVIAPGAILAPATIVSRLALVDQGANRSL
jgi:UDP-N-acetylglucosamine diphosphorylase / glucose-1-phosphate thymidylyltransferase / UDP-N-acetylgalactosamine diphosphorylase / glucosamine-1-phosphate N-acetyltransferase / galactosamine-1-phosphate N-acetyltransferase